MITVRALLDHVASREEDASGLAHRFCLPILQVRAIMAQLAREGLVMPVGDGRWALTPEAQQIIGGADLDRELQGFPDRPSRCA